MQLQIRIGTGPSDDETSLPIEGEPWWDPEKKRLGVWTYEGGKNRVEWLPHTVNDTLNITDRKLSGDVITVDSSELNNSAIDFSAQDEVRIINSKTDGTQLIVDANGLSFPANSNRKVKDLSFYNKILNGNFGVQRSFGVADTETIDDSQRRKLMAPNWLAWKHPGSEGSFDVSLTKNFPDSEWDIHYAMKVTPKSPIENGGISTFWHDPYSFKGNSSTLMVLLWGPVNTQAKIVVRWRQFVRHEMVVEGLGRWHLYGFTFNYNAPPFFEEANYLALNVLENPTVNVDGQSWYVGAAQLVESDYMENFVFRPLEMERKLLESVFIERLISMSINETINLGYNLLPLNGVGGITRELVSTNNHITVASSRITRNNIRIVTVGGVPGESLFTSIMITIYYNYIVSS